MDSGLEDHVLANFFRTQKTHIGKGHNVDVIYLDFSKAFDRVDHTILLHKIERNGITGKFLQ